MLKPRDVYYMPVNVSEGSAYSNYGRGTWAGDPLAPWNRPDPPEWPECAEVRDRGEWLCPECEWRGECEESEVDGRCS